MSNTISFLEAMGRATPLAPLDFAAAVAALEIDETQRQALVERDHAALSRLLDGRARMICMVNAPAQDEPENFPDDADVPDEDEVLE